MVFDQKWYMAETSGVKIKITYDDCGCRGFIFISRKMGPKIGAIHLHKNKEGVPGPIIQWLATTPEWEHGVAQNTPLSNSPCCSNRMCTLNAPHGTPCVRNMIGYTIEFDYPFLSCDCQGLDCDISENFSENFLVVYGKNFQQVKNGCPTSVQPGLDLLSSEQLSETSSPC